MKNGLWRAIFLIAGTTIGAGIFGIPYITSQVGYCVGLIWLVGLTVFVIWLNRLYVKVIERSGKKPQQIVGYSEQYFGKKGKYAALIIILFGQWGALLAYLIGVGDFLGIIFNQPHNAQLLSIIFFIVSAIITALNLKVVSVLESWLTLGMVLIVGLITINGAMYVQLDHLQAIPSSSVADWFAPYGIIMGALMGFAVIPEVSQVIQKKKSRKEDLRVAVTIGSLIPAVVYFVFQFTVVGVSGPATTQEAIHGLVPFLDDGVVRLGALFGAMAMFSSFLTLTHVLKDAFQFDLNFSGFRAWFLAIFPPFWLFLIGFTSFIAALEIMGVWLGTSSAVLIILLYRKSRPQSKRS